MPIVLQNSTVTGNTATGQDSNLLNDLVSQTSERDAGDASGGTSGRQLDSFVVTFDRPVEPSGPEFDAQGRLLMGTDGGIWSGGGDDLLIGGRTTFDCDTDGNDFMLWRKSGTLDTNAQTFGDQFRGGITVAVGDMEASKIAAGTQLASVTDLIIDSFNPDSSAVHDVSITKHSDDGDNWEMVVKVLNAETGSFGDGSVRSIPPAVQVNPPSWGLDRIDQRAADAGTGKVSVHDISISKQCDDAGGVNVLLGDGSVRHVDDAAAPFFAYGDDFMGGVSVAASDALPSGRLYLATDVGVFEQGVIAGGGSWGLDRIDQRDLPGGQGSVFDTSYDLLV